MGNRAYFVILFALLVAIFLANRRWPFGFNQGLVAAGVLVFYVWCKDVFSGTNWRNQPWPTRASTAYKYEPDLDDDNEGYERQYDFSAEELAALPELSAAERAGYRQLVSLCLPAEEQAEVMAFVERLKDFSHAEGCPTTLEYVFDACEAESWYFITSLNRKTSIYTLHFVLKMALSLHRLVVALPDPATYPPRTSVSTAGVLADFDRSLRAHGLQLGFIDTGSDVYVFVVHREADAAQAATAVGRIGYRYFTA